MTLQAQAYIITTLTKAIVRASKAKNQNSLFLVVRDEVQDYVEQLRLEMRQQLDVLSKRSD